MYFNTKNNTPPSALFFMVEIIADCKIVQVFAQERATRTLKVWVCLVVFCFCFFVRLFIFA